MVTAGEGSLGQVSRVDGVTSKKETWPKRVIIRGQASLRDKVREVVPKPKFAWDVTATHTW